MTRLVTGECGCRQHAERDAMARQVAAELKLDREWWMADRDWLAAHGPLPEDDETRARRLTRGYGSALLPAALRITLRPV